MVLVQESDPLASVLADSSVLRDQLTPEQVARLKAAGALMVSMGIESADPAMMARKWVSKGARRLHLVDLDGAERLHSSKLACSNAACARFGQGLPELRA